MEYQNLTVLEKEDIVIYDDENNHYMWHNNFKEALESIAKEDLMK